ncbi:hypothetical protein IQ13_1024 [Lacibacter cauensis]|uniref:Uncharacterized protein n=1 Tax=Lacibacter cauensis TaxID=510947 RepID=A0A562SX30_9BACT|nr:hypothetical protein IQ13_1024 [Lacibacter cauensis]
MEKAQDTRCKKKSKVQKTKSKGRQAVSGERASIAFDSRFAGQVRSAHAYSGFIYFTFCSDFFFLFLDNF